jgi:hypothetical protein
MNRRVVHQLGSRLWLGELAGDGGAGAEASVGRVTPAISI